MPAKEYVCRVIETIWLTPTVVGLRFQPAKRLNFEPGQFVSVVIPGADPKVKPLRRAYSLAAPLGAKHYELCVKHVPGGPGSGFIAGLRSGDVFRIYAPYGELCFRSTEGRRACFISTGTGIAPFRSIVLSEFFSDNQPLSSCSIFGASTEDEIIYPHLGSESGIESIVALSRPQPNWAGFHGRVTDYLKQLPQDWPWQETDFYLCGNGEMVAEARKILMQGRGVSKNSIIEEIYFTSPRDKVIALPLPFKKVA